MLSIRFSFIMQIDHKNGNISDDSNSNSCNENEDIDDAGNEKLRSPLPIIRLVLYLLNSLSTSLYLSC